MSRKKPNRPQRALSASLTPWEVLTLDEASSFLESGDLSGAQSLYKRVIKRNKRCIPALRGLGAIALKRNESDLAIDYFQSARRLAPKDPTTVLLLARTHLNDGHFDEALKACDRALVLARDFAAYALLAEIHEAMDHLNEAIDAYLQALSLNVDSAAAHNNIASLYRRTGQFGRALEHLGQAREIDPRSIAVLNNIGNVFKDRGEIDSAVKAYHDALDLRPKDFDTLYNLALALQRGGDSSAAISRLREIIELDANHEPARIQIIECLINLGRFEEAQEEISAVLGKNSHCAQAWYLKTTLERYTNPDSEDLNAIRELASEIEDDPSAQAFVEFALGKIYDDMGSFDDAFAHFSAGNSQRHAIVGGATSQSESLYKQMIESHSDDWVAGNYLPRERPKLIFIIGMPRSGTTLIEQALASMPAISSAGEVDYFVKAVQPLVTHSDTPGEYPSFRSFDDNQNDRLRQGFLETLKDRTNGASCIIDKTPANYYFVGLIRRLFPGASIIHCERHPLDTCLSLYFQLFDSVNYAQTFDEIAAEYRRYRALIQHWQDHLNIRMLNVRYEDVITSNELMLRRICAGCDLPWDPTCLKRELPSTSTDTMSRWQARQPIYSHSIGRWKNYATQLEPLRGLLDEHIAAYEDDSVAPR